MDDSPTTGGEEGDGTAGERFSAFAKRNVLLVAVFFLSNLVTAVSTLVTAVTVLRDSRTDWHAAEYRKLRELRAGYTLEKFQKELGPPVFRTPLESGGGFVRNVYRPRQEYWVEVISNKIDAAVTYAVTSCEPSFRPAFSYGGTRVDRNVVLNQNTLADVLPADELRGQSLKVFFGGTGSSDSLVFQVYGGSGGSDYREFAWGLNDVCPQWQGKSTGRDLRVSWEQWYADHRPAEDPPAYTYVDEQVVASARALMAESVVNTYAETAVTEQMLTYYPSQIGVSRLTVQ
ncbi:ETEC_3214 domain-containing protein [Streptomyces sp. NPDC127092]|uniref:ETEC_3214 domain-containing protein n=1 Tax=Streptomyces sp. NPDC127092 TaxID=3347135 RepID=UPI0036612271